MEIDFDGVELGLVVNLNTLREVLKTLSVDGRRWWIASDPCDALERGYITIGHGDPCCEDRLNTLYFRIPVLDHQPLMTGAAGLLFLFDPSTSCPENSGNYLENGRMVQDALEDFTSFYIPIKDALITRLQAGHGQI
jgi:hypothetical protein